MVPMQNPVSNLAATSTIDLLTARLGSLARRASSSEALLQDAAELVHETTGATKCGLYLCNTSMVAILEGSGSDLTFVQEAILLASAGQESALFPDRVDFSGGPIELEKALSEACSTKLGNSSHDTTFIVTFFQDTSLRGALVIQQARKDCDYQAIQYSFNEFCVMLELVTDRYLSGTLVKLNAKCLMLLSDHPHQCMSGILQEASKMIGCFGISFFALDPYDESDLFHLVGTSPNAMPTTDLAYAKQEQNLTSRILACDSECTIHYPTVARNELTGFEPPKWKDVPASSKSETVIYINLIQAGESIGLLRCTNRVNKAPSPWFNWIDIRRARSLASLLLPYYKAAQKEDRFASSLSDISHEIKTMAGSIRYTAQNIHDQLIKWGDTGKIQDMLLKLVHIERSTRLLHNLLPALRMEAEVSPENTSVTVGITRGFRPYADLCKPIAEMYIQKARKRRIAIEHYGQDQLGLIYADINDFKHIVENLMSNAVKYTIYGTPIYIRYQRPSPNGQFASIVIASHSLPIKPEEAEFIFKYRHRAIAAKNSDAEGEGIGLAIARAKARRYNGDVVYRNDKDINIFSVLIPRSLFHQQNINNETAQ